MGEATIWIVQAGKATDPSVWTWIFDKVAGPLVTGIVLAGLGGWYFARTNEKYKSKRDLYSKSADAIRTQLLELIKLSADYWSANYSAKKSPCQEGQIDYLLSDISSLSRSCTGALWAKNEDRGPMLIGALFIAVSGSPHYRSTSRTADPSQIAGISTAASDLAEFVADARTAYFRGDQAAPRPSLWVRATVVVLILMIIVLQFA